MEVLFRDDQFIAVNKPPGTGVHRSGLVRDDRTVTDIAAQLAGRQVFTLHRLDRPASGVLLFALDKETAAYFTGDIWRTEVSKTYLALTRGFVPEEGLIDIPLSANHKRERPSQQRRRERRGDEAAEAGIEGISVKEAVTRYTVLDRFELPLPSRRYDTSRFSLVEVFPETGRFHQIRRHFARIGFPLIGDTTHGDSKTNALVNEHFGHTRLQLHCVQMSFPHPVLGRTAMTDAPLFDDMKEFISRLRGECIKIPD